MSSKGEEYYLREPPVERLRSTLLKVGYENDKIIISFRTHGGTIFDFNLKEFNGYVSSEWGRGERQDQALNEFKEEVERRVQELVDYGKIYDRLVEQRRTNEFRNLLNDPEPFIDGLDRGFIIPSYGMDCVRTIDEWKEIDEKLGKNLSIKAEKFDKYLWPLPGRISLDEDPRNLLEDMVAYIKDYVEFPSERTYYAFAAWIISTHLIDWLSHAPRIIVNAPTEHGKGRVCKMVALLSYRGVYLGDPSIAVLYHLTSWNRATIVIDELQDIAKSQKELFIRIMGVFKLGFDIGTLIPRMNPDNTEIDAFKTYSFWMVASKYFTFTEDQQNRSIMITMRKRTRELKPDPMNDKEALEKAFALRTRLYGLRVRVALGLIDIEPLKQVAYDLSNKDFEYYENEDGQETARLQSIKIRFGDRTKDKVRALLIPSGLYGHEREVLTTVALSQERALLEERSTYDAQIFYALQFVLDEYRVVRKEDIKIIEDQVRAKELEKQVIKALNETKVWINDIKDQLNRDIKVRDGVKDIKISETFKKRADEEEDDSKKKSTRFVGNVLRNNLSFTTKEGAGRKHFLTPRGFIESYRSCLSAFGSRFDVEEDS